MAVFLMARDYSQSFEENCPRMLVKLIMVLSSLQ